MRPGTSQSQSSRRGASGPVVPGMAGVGRHDAMSGTNRDRNNQFACCYLCVLLHRDSYIILGCTSLSTSISRRQQHEQHHLNVDAVMSDRGDCLTDAVIEAMHRLYRPGIHCDLPSESGPCWVVHRD